MAESIVHLRTVRVRVGYVIVDLPPWMYSEIVPLCQADNSPEASLKKFLAREHLNKSISLIALIEANSHLL
jgi:hypothetical protein